MFHDPNHGITSGIARALFTWTTVVLVPPFVALAVAPMLLVLAPLALIALPFMVAAFFTGAADNHMETRRIDAWRPARARLAEVAG
jgi:hypothetical protein